MERAQSRTIYQILDELGIAYRTQSHEPAYTMEDLTEVERSLGAEPCKNLFLTNRQGTEFFLLLIGKDKRFRTAEISKKVGKSRLSFGPEDMLYELLGVYPGAITPMGLVFDTGHRVQLLMDRDLLELGDMSVHPCVNTETMTISIDDLMNRFFPHTGHKPMLLEITGEIPEET